MKVRLKKIRTWLSQIPSPNLLQQPPPQQYRHPSELWAANWLQARGLQLIAHNYQIRGGEIDLVMQDAKTLVFVEVRYRQHSHKPHGLAAETVNRRKQEKLLRAAQHYLQQTGTINSACRFDVISLDQLPDGGVSYQWYRNAFGEN